MTTTDPEQQSGKERVRPSEPTRVVISDPQAVRALAHRARMDALDELYASGRSRTATELAARSNLSPSAMSYHLRALERFGLVERAESEGDARERRWKATGDQIMLSSLSGSLASTHAFNDMQFGQHSELLKAEVEYRVASRERGEVGPELPYQGRGSMVLDAESEHEFIERTFDLLREFELRAAQVDDNDASARRVHYLLSVFPEREPVEPTNTESDGATRQDTTHQLPGITERALRDAAANEARLGHQDAASH